jgi:hypothetical protein
MGGGAPMSYTLSALITDTLKRLNKISVRVASGGSTASVVVSSISGQDDDDAWNLGYIFIIKTTDGLAPQGEYAAITDYVSSTGTFSCATSSFTVTVGAGDTVGYCNADDYPIPDVIDQVNLALFDLGDIVLTDISTLTTAAQQSEYSASVAWKRTPPIRIDIQKKNDTNDYQWQELSAWEYIPSAPGSAGLIIFRESLPSGYLLRIWYLDRHPEVTIFSSVISESIKPSLAQVAVLNQLLSWKNVGLSGQDDFLLQFRNEIMGKLEQERQLSKPYKPNRKNKIVRYGARWNNDRILPP